MTDILLTAIIILLLAHILQFELAHRSLMRLLGDFATMVGEVFPFLRQLTGKE